MIIFFLYFFFITFSVLGYGLLFKNFLIKKKIITELYIGEVGILGFFNLYFLSLFLHFFTPLYPFLNLIIIFTGVIIFLLKYNNVVTNIKKFFFLLIFLLIFFGLFNIKNHPDFDWYYLPYINYLNSFKIIFGIVNINDFLGYTHSWIDISGIFVIPFIGVKGITLIPIIFYIFCLFSMLEYFFLTKNYFIKYFILFIISFCISNYTKTSEFGGDLPSTVLSFLIAIIFIKISSVSKNEDDWKIKIIFLFFFACILRVNYIILFPLLIHVYFVNFKHINNLLFKKKIILFFLIISSFYLTKNIIVSGCAVYPIPYTCIDEKYLTWSIGKDLADERYNLVSASSKGWQQHLFLDGKLENRYQYYEILNNSNILSPKEYLNKSKFYWVKYWYNGGDLIKNINSFLIVFFSFLLLFLFSKVHKFNFHKLKKIFINKNKQIFSLFLVFILWFLLSPQSRYGGDTAIVALASVLFAIFISSSIYKKNYLKYGILFVLTISISYFEYKNVKRFLLEFNSDSINYPFSNIQNYVINDDFYIKIINKFPLNLKKNNKQSLIGMPTWCGNIKMLCLPEDRIVCVSNIVYNKYLFITPDRKKCLIHLKKRLWY